MNPELRFSVLVTSLVLLAVAAAPMRVLGATSANPASTRAVAQPVPRMCSGMQDPAGSAALSAAQLSKLRSGEELIRIGRLGKLVSSFRECRGERLVLRYPAGTIGALWAEELRVWLVSLGVPSDRIVLNPELQRNDNSVTIAIKRQGEQAP